LFCKLEYSNFVSIGKYQFISNMNNEPQLIIPEVVQPVKVKSQKRIDNMKRIRQHGKVKGSIHAVTKVKQKVGLDTWQAFGDWLATEGIQGYKARMSDLSDKEYIIAFNMIIEYFKPKLSRKQIDMDASIHVDGVSFE
jgi:hypothetical protein